MISFLKKYGNKFRYAFAGLMHGLLHDRSIVLQAVLGMVVLCGLCLSGAGGDGMVRHSDRHWCCDCTGIYQFRSGNDCGHGVAAIQ